MPIKRYTLESGLSKRDHTAVKPPEPPTTAEFEEVNLFLRLGYSFEERMAPIEAYAIQKLKAAGLRSDGSADIDEKAQSPEWYANRIVRRLNIIRGWKDSIAAEEGFRADLIATVAFSLALLVYEAGYKELWEPDTELGMKVRRSRSKGGRATKRVRIERDRFLRQLADVHRRQRKKRKKSNEEIARHIKKQAERETQQAVEGGNDRNQAKLWAKIDRLSKDRIRIIIRK